ncbi:MAG: hypothetical protein AVDCRST_MAG30-1286, partial [uncultured Solirubrobacteraceae bacterium]
GREDGSTDRCGGGVDLRGARVASGREARDEGRRRGRRSDHGRPPRDHRPVRGGQVRAPVGPAAAADAPRSRRL